MERDTGNRLRIEKIGPSSIVKTSTDDSIRVVSFSIQSCLYFDMVFKLIVILCLE